MKPKLLIVDDDVAITRQLFWMLCDEFEVLTAHDLQTAIRRATVYEPDVSIIDLHLPPTVNSTDTGVRVLEYVKGRLPASKVFVISWVPMLRMRYSARPLPSAPCEMSGWLFTSR